MKNLVSIVMGIFLLVPAFAQRLDVVSFTSSEESGFVTSYILSSGKQSILVDPPIASKDVHRLIDTIRRLNRHILGVLITCAHPSHFLGVSEIKMEFPGIKVMATRDVSTEISKSGARLKDRIRPNVGPDMTAIMEGQDSIIENSITLENCKLDVLAFHNGEASSTTVLYEPKQKLLFTGDIVYNQVHLYTLEHRINGWQGELEELKKFSISILYPGYGPPADKESIDNCINYIQTFQRALITNDSVAVFDIMNYYFPGYMNQAYLQAEIDKYLGMK